MILGIYFVVRHDVAGKKMPREAEAGGAGIVRMARREGRAVADEGLKLPCFGPEMKIVFRCCAN